MQWNAYICVFLHESDFLVPQWSLASCYYIKCGKIEQRCQIATRHPELRFWNRYMSRLYEELSWQLYLCIVLCTVCCMASHWVHFTTVLILTIPTSVPTQEIWNLIPLLPFVFISVALTLAVLRSDTFPARRGLGPDFPYSISSLQTLWV